MSSAHLTDKDIQVYATGPEALSDEQRAHISECAVCKAKAANYTLLFKGIHDTPKPAFDFDLSALVMEQLPAPKAAFPWALVLVTLFSTLVVTLSAVLFWASITALIKTLSILFLAAAGIGGIVILLFQAFEMLKVYHKQMDTLTRSKTLQL